MAAWCEVVAVYAPVHSHAASCWALPMLLLLHLLVELLLLLLLTLLRLCLLLLLLLHRLGSHRCGRSLQLPLLVLQRGQLLLEQPLLLL